MGETQRIGKIAEDLACDYLQNQGLKLVTRNFYCRCGEIDLVMRDKEYLVFIEIRSRNTNRFGGGAASITHHKQQKLLKTAQYYLQQNKLLEKIPCRFDVIAILSVQSRAEIEWIKNAF